MVSSFEDLTTPQLTNILIIKARDYQPNKRQIVMKKMEQRRNDKAQLVKLVSEHVKPEDIDSLLSSSPATTSSGSSSSSSSSNGSSSRSDSASSSGNGSSSAMSKKERQRAEKAQAALDSLNMPSADTLRKNARMLSRNPEMARKANPQFRNMSDAEIRQQAREMEKMASDPQMMKTAMQMSTMPTEDKTALQNIQEGMQGQRPRDEKWIEDTIRVVKAKPDVLKMMFKGKINPASGLTEEQIFGFIDYITTCSDWFLKSGVQIINWGIEVSVPVTAAYKVVDEKTLGCAKYIVMAIVFFLLYHLARLFYFLVSLLIGGVAAGYRMLTASAPLPGAASSGATGEGSVPSSRGKGGNSMGEFDDEF